MHETQITPCEVVSTSDRYTLDELYRRCVVETQRFITVRTFRRWRAGTGVKPDSDGLYGAEELDYLVQLSDWLAASKKNTIHEFNLLSTEQGNGNQYPHN